MSIPVTPRTIRHPKCSIVVPVMDEETNIQSFYEALVEATTLLDADWEYIFVDDGSTDKTFILAKEIHEVDDRVKIIRLSRNYGSHAAITAGFLHFSGDAVFQMSADFQDPPEIIGSLLKKWQEGYDIVWAVREKRDDPFFKNLFARAFWFLIRRFALPSFPKRSTDGFGIFDRIVIEEYRRLPERNRMGPLLLSWLGFRQAEVPYHRPARRSGRSKWGTTKKIKAAVDAFVSFSYLPIRMMSLIGITISIVSFLFGITIIIQRIFFGVGGAGWPSVMAVVLFLGGINLLVLGVLGEYIWRVAEEVRNRPLFVIMDRIGVDPDSPPR